MSRLFALPLLVAIAFAQSNPQADVLLKRGLTFARNNRLAEAATTLDEGQRLFPQDPRFAVELAGVAYRLKHISEAKSWLMRALRIEPHDSYSNDFLGTLFLLEGNVPAALKYWNRIGKPFIHEVEFAPTPHLDPLLRARTFEISGGQVFTLRRYDAIQSNLARLNVFARDTYTLDSMTSDQFRLTVRTEPVAVPFQGWVGRLVPALRGLPYQSVTPEFYNVRGKALNVAALVRWDPDKRRLALRLTVPWANNPKAETSYWLDARDEKWNVRDTYSAALPDAGNIVMRSWSAGAQVGLALTERLQWTLGVRATGRHFDYSTGTGLFANGWSAELDNQFDYRLWCSPERRAEVFATGQLRSGRFFSPLSSRLLGTEASVRGTWYPQASNDTYSLRARFTASRLWNSAQAGGVPLDQLNMLGMERDNPDQYWLRGHLGARFGQKGTAPLGREIEVGQIDFARRLLTVPFVRIYLGPWFDFGRAADSTARLGSRGWLYDSGLEARVATIGGMQVRFIYGRDLRDGRGAFYTAISRSGVLR